MIYSICFGAYMQICGTIRRPVNQCYGEIQLHNIQIVNQEDEVDINEEIK